MPNVLASGDLDRLAARIGGWIAGSVAASPTPTTTAFAITGYDLTAAPSLAGALVVVGHLTRQVGQVQSNSGSTLTLSKALDTAPAVGDPVVIFPQVAVNFSGAENIQEVGGVALPTGQSGNPNVPVTVDGSTIQQPTEIESAAQNALASTTTALGANATYTSATLDAAPWRRLIGTVISDQAGTLYVQQSPDGTNWDVQSSFSVAANDATGGGVGWSVEVVAPYARLYYVNGATGQTVFRLYAWGVPLA